jgi:NAD(P)-dependent dehydrogenase (short-subunit alcohol dehydrogenase family)
MAPKVIIVTGASKGIGLAIARYLLAAEHSVILAARSKDQLEALKAQYPNQVEFVTGDLGDFSVSRPGSSGPSEQHRWLNQDSNQKKKNRPLQRSQTLPWLNLAESTAWS